MMKKIKKKKKEKLSFENIFRWSTSSHDMTEFEKWKGQQIKYLIVCQ